MYLLTYLMQLVYRCSVTGRFNANLDNGLKIFPSEIYDKSYSRKRSIQNLTRIMLIWKPVIPFISVDSWRSSRKGGGKTNVDLYSVSLQTPLTRSYMDHTVLPANNTISAFTRKHSPGGATTHNRIANA